MRMHGEDDRSERLVLRYHGGKSKLAAKIVGFFPPHQRYVEPYGGAASVLLHKPCGMSTEEVYNDIDDEVVDLFRLLRNSELATQLCQALTLTPYAREEWKRSYEHSTDSVEKVRRFVVRVMMGWGTKGLDPDYKCIWRGNDAHGGWPEWKSYVDNLPRIVARLREVNVENAPAIWVMQKQDAKTTLHYVDPPYHLDWPDYTYKHDMDYEEHEALLKFLQRLKGMVILSGYPSELYDRHLQGWYVKTFNTQTDNQIHSTKRKECLWFNAAAAAYWLTHLGSRIAESDRVTAGNHRVRPRTKRGISQFS